MGSAAHRSAFTRVALFALTFVALAAPAAQAQEPLTFFKNYFVTGDYVVRGVSLWRKGVDGRATALIPALRDPDGDGPLDGVPATADILAAFLYVQTAEKIQGSGIDHAKFTGHDLGPFTAPGSSEPGSGTFAKPLVDWDTASSPCWSVAFPGGRKLVTYRVDVLRFLPIDPVTQKQSLTTAHRIVVPDAGLLFGDDDEDRLERGTSDLPRALGASLIVVYRDRSKPLSAIMLYDGAFTKRAYARMEQPIAGFYQASTVNPSVKMTHIVGDGRLLFSERVYLGSQLIATNPFRSSNGPKWDNVTWQWNQPAVTPSPLRGDASDTTVRVDPHTLLSDCLTYSAIAFRTTVQDTDTDGLIDIWESSQSALDDPNVPNDPATGAGYLPDLRAMGADPNVPDIFAQVDYLYTAGPTTYGDVTKPAHHHLPAEAALTMVGDAFANAPIPIRVHFDVGDNYQGNPYVVPAEHARGGQSLSETMFCPADETAPELTQECAQDPATGRHQMPGQFSQYPGTVGWKTGFAFLKDALLGFDRNRKDIFRYVLAGHFIGLPVEPCLRPLADGTQVSDFTCQDSNPLFRVPRTNSGIADFPGAELLLSLGGFDNADGLPVGSVYQVASTIMHEWGHTFLLTHAGILPPPDPATFLIQREPNCKPNYFSVMNYLFQLRGLPDVNGILRLDYSRETVGGINEFGLIDGPLFPGADPTLDPFRYRTGWYAPRTSSYVKNLGVKAATKHCDGSLLTPDEQADLDNGGGMVRIDASSVFGNIDWNADGTIGGAPPQDVNFNGLIDGDSINPALQPSSNDWMAIRLNELGGRRNVGGYYVDTFGRNAVGPMSLDVGRGDIGRGDIGRGDIGRGDIGRGDIGRGDIGVSVGRGDIGRGDIGRGDIGRGDIGLPNQGRGDIGRGDIGRGDIGRGGGDLDVGGEDEPEGDLPVETAKAAEGDAETGPPTTLFACLTAEAEICVKTPEDAVGARAPVNVAWLPPTLGAADVVDYKLYRLQYQGPFEPFEAPADLSAAIEIATVAEGTAFSDHDAPSGAQLAYFARARYDKRFDATFDAMACVADGGTVLSETTCRLRSAISNFSTVRTPSADLTIVNYVPASPERSVAPGAAVTLSSWRHLNQGNGGANAADGTISNGFYLSADPVITTADIRLDGNVNTNGVLPAGGYFDWGGPTLTIPAATAPGPYYIGILVDEGNEVAESDEENNFVSEPVSVTVGLAPIANPQNVTVAINTSLSGTLTGSDPEGAPLTFAIGRRPAHGSLSEELPAVTYTPDEGFTGADSFTFTVSDGVNTSPEATVSIKVSDFAVRNTSDSGAGSLRQAIIDANEADGTNTITFDIAGAGPHTIAPLTPLPIITDPVVIDGYTQPGAVPASDMPAVLMIELSGQSQPAGSGLRIHAGNSIVRGLAINRFPSDGISLRFNGQNTIEGNHIGTNLQGTAAGPGNAAFGIHSLSPNNTIGGTTPAARNVISGNLNAGVRFGATFAPGSTTEVVTTGEGGVVKGNYIGTNATGTAAIGNVQDGVRIWTPNVKVGGPTATERNVISGNGNNGVFTSARTSGENNEGVVLFVGTNAVIQGNFIGTDVTGMLPIPNNRGIQVSTNVTIGGTGDGQGNVISGNVREGIVLNAAVNPQGEILSMASGSVVQGNYIGTDVSGTIALANQRNGINVHVPNVTIGSTEPLSAGDPCISACNLVSGNGSILENGNTTGGGIGLFVQNFTPSDGGPVVVVTSATGTTVRGNYIGLNAMGNGVVKNLGNGISVNTAKNTIDANVVSGSGLGPDVGPCGDTGQPPCIARSGIRLGGAGATGNVVTGNFVGTDATGTMALDPGGALSVFGNTGPGVHIFEATGNRIGGFTPPERNVIAGNLQGGVNLNGAPATANVIRGNYIGTDKNGAVDLGNLHSGVGFYNGAHDNLVGGGDADDGDVDGVVKARNIISGNEIHGVDLGSSGGGGNIVKGNYIGTNATGMAPIGNTCQGVGTSGPGLVVGGTEAGAGNLISGNAHTGGPSTVCLPGHLANGIGIFLGASGTVVQGNVIGAASDGVTALPNAGDGVFISRSSNNRIGGDLAAGGNLIAFNGRRGVNVDAFSAPATRNAILSNRIFANGQLGIDLTPGGGSFGVNANDTGDADGGANNGQNFPLLTSSTTTGVQGTLHSTAATAFTLQFFASDACDASRHGEGERFLGSTSVTTDDGGNAEFAFAFAAAVGAGLPITATATDPDGNTSEFSLCSRNAALTLLVNNTNDSGPGSFRQAILNANVPGYADTITFNIPGPGPHTIAPLSPLPTVLDPVTIDGYTQPGASPASNPPATLMIELNGANAGANANGLDITAGGSTVRGLVINRFGGSGIHLRGVNGGNVIEGNYLGTDVTGTISRGNRHGIGNGAPSTTIGGLTTAARNVLSGNSDNGVGNWAARNGAGIVESTGEGALIQGNFIGTDATGTVAVPNGLDGVTIGVPNVVVGGTIAGARNVISGNGWGGISIFATTVSSTGPVVATGANAVVQGNFIGTNAAGTARLANGRSGVWTGVPNVTIGGTEATTPGGPCTGACNLISGNSQNGVLTGAHFDSATGVALSFATGAVVLGNVIGLDVTGTLAIANGAHGILATAEGATIGGTTPEARNVISGNTRSGIDLGTSFTPANVLVSTATKSVVQGNYVGTNSAGMTAVPNLQDGILVHVAGTTIGGASAGAGNLVSGNQRSGIGLLTHIPLAGTTPQGSNTLVQRNYVGVNASGTAALPNSGSGVTVITPNNTIDANVVSGNGAPNASPCGGTGQPACTARTGIVLSGAGATGNTITANFIGTNPTGTTAIPNTAHGVDIIDAPNNVVGGQTAAARNIISGNVFTGVRISGSGATGNLVQGNYIGTDASGIAAVPNRGVQSGIFILNASGNVIGGLEPNLANVISGNALHAVTIVGNGGGAENNLVQGNLIGVDATGLAVLANGGIGVDIVSANNNTIGGNVTAARNVISGNRTGVQIRTGANGNAVRGNYIGVDAAGTAPVPNTALAVHIQDNAFGNRIGGPQSEDGNIIANNGGGVHVLGTTSTGNAILSNSIHSNGALGIDLGGDGVTLNDDGDVDASPNHFQNFPVVTSATSTGVAGTLDSTPNTGFVIQLFSNSVCDASGFGQGRTLIATINVTTDDEGHASFAQAVSLPAGESVTATATDPEGNTSEFSECVTAGGEKRWISDVSGSWHTASNWSGNEVPRPGDVVVIDRPGDLTITYDVGSLSLSSLRSEEHVLISGGQLSVESTATWNGGLTLEWPATLGGSAAMTAASFRLIGGRLEGSGDVTVAGTTTLLGSVSGRTLHLGSSTTTPNAPFQAIGLENNAVVVNPAGSTWTVTSDAEFGVAGNGSISNLGTLAKLGTGLFRIDARLDNAGAIDLRAGTLLMSGGGVSTGQFFGQPGSRFSWDRGGHMLTTTSRVDTRGLVEVGGELSVAGAFTAEETLVQGFGRLALAGQSAMIGTVTVSSNNGLTFGAATPGSIGTANVGATINTSSNLTIGTLNWTSGGFNFPVPATVVVTGPTSFSNGGIGGDGGRVRLGPQTTFVDGATLTMGGGTSLVNPANGQMQVLGTLGLIWNVGGSLNPTVVVNEGTLVKQGAGTTATMLNLALENNGTVDLQGGALALLGGSTSNGLFTGAAGTTLTFGGVSSLNPGSRVDTAGTVEFGGQTTVGGFLNAGAVDFLAGQTNFTGTVGSLGSAMSINGATIQFDGPAAYNIPPLTLISGQLGGTATITTPSFSWQGGSLRGTGILEVTGPTTLGVSGPDGMGIVQRTLRLGTSTLWQNGSTFPVGRGTIINPAGGTLRFDAEAIFEGEGSLINLGTFEFVGPARRLALTGAMTFSNQGRLVHRLGGIMTGQYDRIAMGSPVTLGGTLDIRTMNGFAPSSGDSFELFTYPSASGQFEAIEGNGEAYTVTYGSTELTATRP